MWEKPVYMWPFGPNTGKKVLKACLGSFQNLKNGYPSGNGQ
jgi:hypothetical protein